MRHPLEHDDDQDDQDLETLVQAEKIYELRQENTRLRGQITYLQEELASAEDDLFRSSAHFENKIEELERQLGDALYGK